MTGPTTPAIISAPAIDMDRTFAALTTAFISDPFMRWMMPEPAQYLMYFGQVVRVFGVPAFENSSAYRSSDFMAAALWLPPGVRADEESLGELMQTAVDEALQEEVFAVLEQVGNSHPAVDHWYLPAIGVDPRCQGRGYGSALLARSLEACDRAHDVAYLESSNPRNVPLYQRYGFEVIGEIQVGSSPTVTPMVRAAR